MSCGCPQSSSPCGCAPCTDCPPVSTTTLAPCVGEPCEEIIDAKCVVYSGSDLPCLDIDKDMRLNQILQKLEAFCTLIKSCVPCATTTTTSTTTLAPSTTTTSTTTTTVDPDPTTTTSTTSTTTVACDGCVLYRFENELNIDMDVLYTPCDSDEMVPVPIPAFGVFEVCAKTGSYLWDSLVTQVSCCADATTTTSTSTTTTIPTECREYTIENKEGTSIKAFYVDCTTGLAAEEDISDGDTVTVCAVENSVSVYEGIAAVITEIGTCTPATTSTTSTTSTSTTTSTTTTEAPICEDCQTVELTNISDSSKTVTWLDCVPGDGGGERLINVGVEETVRLCVCGNSMIYDAASFNLVIIGQGCIPATTTSTTSTTTSTTSTTSTSTTTTQLQNSDLVVQRDVTDDTVNVGVTNLSTNSYIEYIVSAGGINTTTFPGVFIPGILYDINVTAITPGRPSAPISITDSTGLVASTAAGSSLSATANPGTAGVYITVAA
jgi:hypothetical protein